jgi:hypothetical protein
MGMKNKGIGFWMAAVTLLLMSGPAFAQTQGRAVVTVLPKHEGQVPVSVTGQDLAVKVDGKTAEVTKWQQYREPGNSLELVLLLDSSARTSLGRQMGDIEQFVRTLPPNIKAGIAYMENGRAVFAGPLSGDHAQVLKNLHLPSGMAGTDSSPYFCLSDLAKRWPSQDSTARREVVMVTDGVDSYMRRYNPDDPYVQTAINDAVRARVVVYSIYWMNQGRADSSQYENNAGQNLLIEVSDATGGKSFWMGMGNPVSFGPYFDELIRRFRNQYELGFIAPAGSKPQVDSLKLKLSAPGTEVNTPQLVYVTPPAGN